MGRRDRDKDRSWESGASKKRRKNALEDENKKLSKLMGNYLVKNNNNNSNNKNNNNCLSESKSKSSESDGKINYVNSSNEIEGKETTGECVTEKNSAVSCASDGDNIKSCNKNSNNENDSNTSANEANDNDSGKNSDIFPKNISKNEVVCELNIEKTRESESITVNSSNGKVLSDEESSSCIEETLRNECQNLEKKKGKN